MNFDEWFMKFWNKYDKKYTDNCSPKKGAIPKAKTAAKTAMNRSMREKESDSPEGFMKMCDMALDAQKAYWDEAKRRNKWMPNFPMVVTWFNQSRWGLELDSHSELREQPQKAMHKSAKPNIGVVTDINKANEYRELAKLAARGLLKNGQ